MDTRLWITTCTLITLTLAACETTPVSPAPVAGMECHQHLQDIHWPHRDHAADMLAAEYRTFEQVAERALVFRQSAIEGVHYLREKIETDQPLSGHELEQLNQGLLDYLDIRQGLINVALSHECWLQLPPAQLQAAGLGDHEKILGSLHSLAAALILYDNYMLAISLFEQTPKLRKFLNQPDRGYRITHNHLNRIRQDYISTNNRERIRQGIQFYQDSRGRLVDTGKKSGGQDYLLQLIEQSPAYQAMQRRALPPPVLSQIDLLATFSADALETLGREGINLFSMFFGNTIGLVETRKGRLNGHRAAHEHLSSLLQPGDILLEKTPFRLTDTLIPGYWGHAAIWTGTETELKMLGIWDHEVVEPHQHALRQRRHIVEALRSGVGINTLAAFMNIDDIAILRPVKQNQEQQAARVLRAFRQIGKAYDFNFDVETTDRIVCSELVYQVYTDMDWPTSRALGRATISPDQVAGKAGDHGPLRVVALYLDGRPVQRGRHERLKKLVN